MIAAAKPRIQVRQGGAAGFKAQRRGVAGCGGLLVLVVLGLLPGLEMVC